MVFHLRQKNEDSIYKHTYINAYIYIALNSMHAKQLSCCFTFYLQNPHEAFNLIKP